MKMKKQASTIQADILVCLHLLFYLTKSYYSEVMMS